MNAHKSPQPTSVSPALVGILITADASKVSGAAFLERFFGSYEAKRQSHFENCIQAIERGDTYGWPPMMVEHCKGLMAERDLVKRDMRSGLIL